MDVEARPPVDQRLRQRLADLGPASRAELLRVLNLPGAEPATLIGALYPKPEFRTLEEDLPALAAVVAELRHMEREDYLRSRKPTPLRDSARTTRSSVRS